MVQNQEMDGIFLMSKNDNYTQVAYTSYRVRRWCTGPSYPLWASNGQWVLKNGGLVHGVATKILGRILYYLKKLARFWCKVL